MAKFPQWTATVDPTVGGPLIVRQPNAGQTGMAMAQLGQTIAGVGQYLTAEGRQAAERTAELDRIRQASTITRQATSELRKFSDEIRRDPDPANYERRFEEVSSSILAGLDAIEDPEVRTRAQVKIDSELDFHQRDMLTWRMQAQQKAFEQEYLQAEQDAVRTGNVEAVETPLQALVDAGFTTPEQAARAKSVVEAKTIVWQTALAKGWTEGLKYATDPETLAELPLSPEKRQAFKSELESYLRTEQTLAEIDARKQQAQIEQTKNALFADAMSDKLDDPTKIDAALRAGVVSPAEAKQLQELVKKGPPEQSDLMAISQVREAILDYQTGAKTQTEAQEVIRSNVGKLSPDDAKSMTSRLYGEVESELSYWQREANANIEDSIYPRDYFGQQERKEPYVTIASEVKLRLDKAIEDARKASKPLAGRDIVIKARDLVAQARQDIKKYEERIEAEGFGAGVQTRKVLDLATAVEYLRRAGGDREKAKKMAAQDGYEE